MRMTPCVYVCRINRVACARLGSHLHQHPSRASSNRLVCLFIVTRGTIVDAVLVYIACASLTYAPSGVANLTGSPYHHCATVVPGSQRASPDCAPRLPPFRAALPPRTCRRRRRRTWLRRRSTCGPPEGRGPASAAQTSVIVAVSDTDTYSICTCISLYLQGTIR